MHLDKIYRRRFNEYECEQKNKNWEVLCPDFFQQFIPEEARVLDIGAGYCEFINNIRCREKLAVDLNEDTPAMPIQMFRLQIPLQQTLAFYRTTQ